MTRLSESNSNDYRSQTRQSETANYQIQKSSHHAVTSIRSNSTTNYLNITEQLTNFVFEHAKKCKDADRELEAILRQHGRQRGVNK